MPQSLTEKYRKFDSVGDDSSLGYSVAKCDLDAVSGPTEEVEAIQRHWREQDGLKHRGAHRAIMPRDAQSSPQRGERQQPTPPQPPHTGPAAVQRPLPEQKEEGRPATERRPLEKSYQKWESFDADGAELDVDNSDKKEPEEAAQMLRATGNSVGITCVDYKKDREEFDLDKELETRTGDLRSSIGQRLQAAVKCKEDGNAALRGGRTERALEEYEGGLHVLQFCVQAKVLMAPGLVQRVDDLLVPLHANAAQALLQLERWQGCESHASEVLSLKPAHAKALWRRAVARQKMGKLAAAKEDLRAALKDSPQNTAVQKLLKQIEEQESD